VNQLSETDKAYIAGFMDGEGCINISRYKGPNNRTPVYGLQLIIAQKSRKGLEDLCQMIGAGNVYDSYKREYLLNCQYRLTSREAAELLTEIFPYLKLKREEAEVAIEFQAKQGHKHSTGRGYTIPEAMVKEKEKYYLKLRSLKTSVGKGRPANPSR
jgi:hypothetical protein